MFVAEWLTARVSVFIKLTVCFGVCLSRKSINESKNVSGMAAEVMGRFNVFCDLGICHDFFFFFWFIYIEETC